ncbi:MAG: pilus assembly protein PilM [Spirochaetota bacterium]|nr:pilus assembly protein PilM [Spirochaetota bacterium]
MFGLFRKKNYLGIDIGTAALKIVELGRDGDRLRLQNYGITEPKMGVSFKTSDFSNQDLGGLIAEVIKTMKPKTKRAVISLPVFSSFSTVLDLPPMSSKEIPAAIQFEARKYVPVNLNEVELDWIILGESEVVDENKHKKDLIKFSNKRIQVLLIAVPKEIVSKYTEIARIAGLKLSGLEQESFALIRSLIGNDKGTYLIADIGTKSTDIVVVDGGYMKFSHDIEQIDKEAVVIEIEKVINLYQSKYQKKIDHCIIVGGRMVSFTNEQSNNLRAGADLRNNWVSFLRQTLGIDVIVGNPLARIIYPPILKDVVNELGPTFAVSVGLAMRNL